MDGELSRATALFYSLMIMCPVGLIWTSCSSSYVFLPFREFRAAVIDMVLNTDMSLHFAQVKNMKNLIAIPEM